VVLLSGGLGLEQAGESTPQTDVRGALKRALIIEKVNTPAICLYQQYRGAVNKQLNEALRKKRERGRVWVPLFGLPNMAVPIFGQLLSLAEIAKAFTRSPVSFSEKNRVAAKDGF
jgi:hypothetical protein